MFVSSNGNVFSPKMLSSSHLFTLLQRSGDGTLCHFSFIVTSLYSLLCESGFLTKYEVSAIAREKNIKWNVAFGGRKVSAFPLLRESVIAGLCFSHFFRPPPFFFSISVECICWYWVGGSDWKKKKTYKKNHKKFRNRRPWYPGTTFKVNFHIIGLTKCTICCKNYSCFSLCCYYDHFSDRIKELFQVKNGLTTSLLFFWKMPKIWVGRTTLNGEKKRLALSFRRGAGSCPH